jgi:pilus assembly protein Flp/PilA
LQVRHPALVTLFRTGATIGSIVPRTPTRGSSTVQRGATAVEYGLLVALIAAAIVFSVLVFRGEVVGLFEHTNASIDNAVTP